MGILVGVVIVLVVLYALGAIFYPEAHSEASRRGYAAGRRAATPSWRVPERLAAGLPKEVLAAKIQVLLKTYGVQTQEALYAVDQQQRQWGQIVSIEAFIALAKDNPHVTFWLYNSQRGYMLSLTFYGQYEFQVGIS